MTKSQSRRAKAAKGKLQRKLEREPLILEFDYHPGALQALGPIINTSLTITQAHRQALQQAGEAIPPTVTCRFLIDTGSDGTVVKHEFAEQAGLKLINASAPLRGVGIDTTGRVYMGRIVFGLRSRLADSIHTIYVDTQIRSGKLEGDTIDGIIGRDVLRYFTLSCDGQTGKVQMKYHRQPSPSASATPAP